MILIELKKHFLIFFAFVLQAIASSALHAGCAVNVTEMTAVKKTSPWLSERSSCDVKLQNTEWSWKGVLSPKQANAVKAAFLPNVHSLAVKRKNKDTVFLFLDHTKIEISAELQNRDHKDVAVTFKVAESKKPFYEFIWDTEHFPRPIFKVDFRSKNPLSISIANGASVVFASDKDPNEPTVRFIMVTIDDSTKIAR